MNKEDLLYMLPTQRVKPFDGMAVTSEVWDLAHEYHRQQNRFHWMLGHRPGVLTGLDVIASIPPDTSVYILPGVAVDNWGQMIVLSKPLTYNLGDTSEGMKYLLLSHAESRPRSETGRGQEGAPLFIHDEFKLVAVDDLPDMPFVELARINRESRINPIRDAEHAEYPGIDEIDLRFRQVVGGQPAELFKIATSYVGKMNFAAHGEGLIYLAKALNRSGNFRLVVDRDISLDSPLLSTYSLIYLAGQDRFELSRMAMNNLYDYLKKGGTLLFETCQRGSYAEELPAARAFDNLLSSFGFSLEELGRNHELLRQPHLFARPPRGFEAQGVMRLGQGIIFSTYDYGGAWQGQRREGDPTREEIRSTFEWGENIIAYAARRRRAAHDEDDRKARLSLSKQLQKYADQSE